MIHSQMSVPCGPGWWPGPRGSRKSWKWLVLSPAKAAFSLNSRHLSVGPWALTRPGLWTAAGLPWRAPAGGGWSLRVCQIRPSLRSQGKGSWQVSWSSPCVHQALLNGRPLDFVAPIRLRGSPRAAVGHSTTQTEYLLGTTLHVGMCVQCVYARAYMCTCVQMACACAHTCEAVRACVRVHVGVCMRVHTYTCVHACVRVCPYVCVVHPTVGQE